MTFPLSLCLAVIAIPFASILAAPAHASRFYVSPTGSDLNPGTKRKPFATLQAAQKAARAVRGQGAVTVFLRAGTYYLPETLVFTDADSGTAKAPVLYRAYGKERPVISGGIRLNPKWEPYKGALWKTATPPGLTTDQLFVNGERQVLARYPNFDASERIFNGYAADAFSPIRAARWADPQGGFMHAMHADLWGGFSWRINGKDAKDNLIFEGGWQNNRPAPPHHDYRFVENIFEELDAPGEWFLDSKNNSLYYYPPVGVHLESAIIEVVRLKELVAFRGSERSPVRFVTLKGITFQHTARTFMENREPLLRSDWTTYRGGAIFFDGAEDCVLEDSFLDQVGGNAVFVNNYNRRIRVRGCHIARAGANGVAFIGDPAAVRNPNGWTGAAAKRSFTALDRTPGPKTDNYPADCLVDDCLIHETGHVEKQTAPVQISMASTITVRHCSLYNVPRAGINIGDGCWGGHIIEFCDIFDTVKETGDHGSFNSWGRDRWWGTEGIDLQTVTLGDDRDWPRIDAVKPVILRNNRWRCDHGWDIDLDDGSTNYEIRNNLCLNGGIKNREGFYRTVENNIMINNSFHPHVWYQNSQDVFSRNIIMEGHYQPAGGMPDTAWGREMDYNLVHRPGMKESRPAEELAAQSKRDAHSVVADARFMDPLHGDFRVRRGSPALALGFKNFPMNRFGVQKPELKAIAHTPEIPQLGHLFHPGNSSR